MQNLHLVVERDKALEPLPGADVMRLPQPEARWYFKPAVLFGLIVATFAIIGFFWGALSL